MQITISIRICRLLYECKLRQRVNKLSQDYFLGSIVIDVLRVNLAWFENGKLREITLFDIACIGILTQLFQLHYYLISNTY